MQKRLLKVLGISYSESSTASYTLVLEEEEGKQRRLVIVIGAYEAQAIAIELEKMKPQRPLTHDLFKNFAGVFDISITEVVIVRVQNGVFYANIICEAPGQTHEVDARTSDAVALALRFGSPIYASEEVLMAVGMIQTLPEEGGEEITDDEPPADTYDDDEYRDMTDEELREQLDNAVRDEDYEKASRIRDEINIRKTGKQ